MTSGTMIISIPPREELTQLASCLPIACTHTYNDAQHHVDEDAHALPIKRSLLLYPPQFEKNFQHI